MRYPQHWSFQVGFVHTPPTHIYVQTTDKSEFCIIDALERDSPPLKKKKNNI